MATATAAALAVVASEAQLGRRLAFSFRNQLRRQGFYRQFERLLSLAHRLRVGDDSSACVACAEQVCAEARSLASRTHVVREALVFGAIAARIRQALVFLDVRDAVQAPRQPVELPSVVAASVPAAGSRRRVKRVRELGTGFDELPV